MRVPLPQIKKHDLTYYLIISKMKKIKDEYKKELLLDKHNYQVMMEWEKPYMKALVNKLKPTGDVLEIGFGLGYSADQIQQHKIKSHTIIEANPYVLKKLKTWAKKQKHKVNVIEGTWQNKLKTLGTFDIIFFDDSPHEEHHDEDNTRLYDLYHQLITKHVNKNARMTWYCEVCIYWVTHPSTLWSLEPFKIKIPDNCRYIVPRVRLSHTLFIPLLIFVEGIVPYIIPFVINNRNQFFIRQ